MRFILFCLLAMFSGRALAGEFNVSSQVDAVTVFPRGAEVTRITQVSIPAGTHVLTLSDLPAEADPNSIRVEGKATGTLEIGTVDARRVQVLRKEAAAQQTERRRLEDAIEQELDRLKALEADIETKEVQKRFVENLAGLPTSAPSLNGKGVRPQENWAELLALIGTSMADIQKSILRQRLKIRETTRKVEDLKKQLASLAAQRVQRTEVKVNLAAGGDLTADLTVRYQVSRARWRPYYDARLETGSRNVPAKLVLIRRASISQSTGEVWKDVSVALSTARPSGRSGAPKIYPVTVDYYVPPPPVAVPTARVRREHRARGGLMSSRKRVASAQTMAKPAAPIAERDAAVEVAGFQAVFKVPERITVANTRDAKRVKIETIALEPSLVVRAVPKFDPRAYLYAKMVLPKGIAPVLPGQTLLFRDQTFVGKGRLPQLASGETHELGFGVDDAVRVKYTKVAESRGETGLISSSSTDQRRFKISIKNLHERPIAYSLLDQRPEPLNEDIKVELSGRTKPTKQNVKDKRGILAWEGKLGPDQEFQIDFGYVVSWPAEKKIRYSR